MRMYRVQTLVIIQNAWKALAYLEYATWPFLRTCKEEIVRALFEDLDNVAQEKPWSRTCWQHLFIVQHRQGALSALAHPLRMT